MIGDFFRGARAPSRAGDGALAIANFYFLGGKPKAFRRVTRGRAGSALRGGMK